MEWMAWTPLTAAFFAGIALLLIGMTAWQVARPSVARRGVLLPMSTTRGDRLFVGLLGSAFLHLAWIGLGAGPTWMALPLSAALVLAVGRWG